MRPVARCYMSPEAMRGLKRAGVFNRFLGGRDAPLTQDTDAAGCVFAPAGERNKT